MQIFSLFPKFQNFESGEEECHFHNVLDNKRQSNRESYFTFNKNIYVVCIFMHTYIHNLSTVAIRPWAVLLGCIFSNSFCST